MQGEGAGEVYVGGGVELRGVIWIDLNRNKINEKLRYKISVPKEECKFCDVM